MKRERAVLILILAMFVSGCAVTTSQMRMIQTEDGMRWERIKSSSIVGEGMPGSIFVAKGPDGRNIVHFKHKAVKVIWRGDFQSFTFLTAGVFTAKWIDPDGNIFWEEEFSSDTPSSKTYQVSLPVYGSPAKNYPGLWRVDIYYQEKIIDQKSFFIAPYDPMEI